MKHLFTLICLAFFFISCDKDSCDASRDVEALKEEVRIEKLHIPISNIENQKEAELFLSENQILAQYLAKVSNPTSLLLYTSEKKYDTLKLVIREELSNEVISTVEKDLTGAFAYLKYYYPDFKNPELKTVFTGFGPILLTFEQNQIFIGAEYFTSFKPSLQDLPLYLFRHFMPKNIAPKIVMEYARKFEGYDEDDLTVLNEMIAWGKEYYFTSQMIPCIADTLLLERTGEEIRLLEQNKNHVWKHFVTNQLFYKTDRNTKRIYLDPRPKTIEVSDNAPGMIGRWLGYEIVKSYMENNDITLQALMKEPDAKKIFSQSGFKPTIQ